MKWAFSGAAGAALVSAIAVLARTDLELTQPQATLGTGILAVSAAGIAFAGVRYAQTVAISTSKAQLRHQAYVALRQQRQHEVQLEKMSEVEREKHRRQTSHEVMVNAICNLNRARAAITEHWGTSVDMESSGVPLSEIPNRLEDEGYLGKLEDALQAISTDASTLFLLGFSGPHDELRAATRIARRWVLGELGVYKPELFTPQWSKATSTLQAAYQQI
ncbi:hypothetical protein AXA44_45800 [Rhodococcus sp. SC4]|nr:hypothetical protein AXA44_45800 [Rhodococcus sp. SC4]